ncbi:Phenoloxidase-activating factor 1 [Chionoecetes opilio]|uniref:Phenoloxidase-activating factor 1 n=1 Tax=Chionoecetes opilio TaxID=41210 RepID=A0A8J4Y5M7_CHIOP|nr:Phenoloxidase-activating factor 1 [Chionoecetes opilio]
MCNGGVAGDDGGGGVVMMMMMMRMSWKVCYSLVVLATLAATTSGGAVRDRRQARQCPGGEDCILLSVCRPLQDVVAKRGPNVESVIRKAQCDGVSLRDLKVCCPDTGSGSPSVVSELPPTNTVNGEDLIPKGSQCGQSNAGKIVFGDEPPLYAYPWMALLGYNDKNNPSWIAAAPSSTSATSHRRPLRHATFTRRTGPVVALRLGEHNTATNPDCPGASIVNLPCADAPQDVFPEDIIIHTTFHERGPVSDDIALIRLDRKVTLSSEYPRNCVLGVKYVRTKFNDARYY